MIVCLFYLSYIFCIILVFFKYKQFSGRKMWIIEDSSRRFLFLVALFGFSSLYWYYKVTQLYDTNNSVRPCKFPGQRNCVESTGSEESTGIQKNPKKDLFVYIWNPNENLITSLKAGRETFLEHQCEYTNCFITYDESLKRMDDYDAVIFSPDLKLDGRSRPKHENNYKQKFIFASFQPESSVSMIDSELDNYFNLTWTYRLDSDILWRHFIIHNSLGQEIGPKEKMRWEMYYEYAPNDQLKNKLKNKTRAVAWITDCQTDNNEEYIQHLNNTLQVFHLTVDVFRKCNESLNTIELLEKIERDYFFVLAFEKVPDKDYVNGDLLNAMQRMVVPIVRGGADYSRFLPQLSYINTKEYTVKQLAHKIYYLCMAPEEYQRYYQWRNHFTYRDGSSDMCNLCTALNDETNYPAHEQFRLWWYGGNRLNKRLVNIMDKYVMPKKDEQKETW